MNNHILINSIVTKTLCTWLRWRNLKTTFSLWKRIKCIPSILRWGNLKMHFGLVFEEDSGREITLLWRIAKMFSVHNKMQSRRLQILWKAFLKSFQDRFMCKSKLNRSVHERQEKSMDANLARTSQLVLNWILTNVSRLYAGFLASIIGRFRVCLCFKASL